jgi:hypothetical protein
MSFELPDRKAAALIANTVNHYINLGTIAPTVDTDTHSDCIVFTSRAAVRDQVTGGALIEFTAQDKVYTDGEIEHAAEIYATGMEHGIPIPVDQTEGVVVPRQVSRELSRAEVQHAASLFGVLDTYMSQVGLNYQ